MPELCVMESSRIPLSSSGNVKISSKLQRHVEQPCLQGRGLGDGGRRWKRRKLRKEEKGGEKIRKEEEEGRRRKK
jgi:hypothetical protein